jgi:hypothetical protein
LSAFYLPLLVMLAGLILRGVAFEFRSKAVRARWIWDWSFAGGSFAATFIQGMTVGALVEGLPIKNGQYSGGDFGWFSPFAVLCGVGLCLGYALLGACWLVKKCEGEIRETRLSSDTLSRGRGADLPGLVFVYALAENLQIMADGWSGRICSSSRRSPPWQRLWRSASVAAGWMAVLRGYSDFHVGVRDAGDLVLALHDPLRHHRSTKRRRRIPVSLSCSGERACLSSR